MSRKKAFIFDLDGVICYTDIYHYKAWKALADRLGIYFDEEINNRLRGVSRMDSLEIILEKSILKYSVSEKKNLAEEKNEIYKRQLENMSERDLSREVKETLDKLREKGYLLAVGSSSKNTKFILKQIGLEEYFDAVADGTDIIHSKPHPEVFIKAAEKLGVRPEECYVVEDAKTGIQAAKKAGMTALALYGDAKECGMEDYNLSSFEELVKMVE